jgi:arylsulfatase A-like enzyme
MPKRTDKHAARKRGGEGFRTRRILLGGLACLAALLVAGCSGGGGSAQEDAMEASGDRPNIIFVLADDLDYASARQMPNLNSLLVEQGTSFENTFTSMSLCCPSRATILTGLYAHTSGVKGNKPPDGGFEVFCDEGLEEGTIATRLQEEVYRTAYLGKYLNGYGADDPPHVPPEAPGVDVGGGRDGRFAGR